MSTLYRIVLLLLAILLLSSPPPGFAEELKAAQLNEQFLKAARRGKFKEMKKLLSKGADVNAHGRYGETALFFTTVRGDAKGNA